MNPLECCKRLRQGFILCNTGGDYCLPTYLAWAMRDHFLLIEALPESKFARRKIDWKEAKALLKVLIWR